MRIVCNGGRAEMKLHLSIGKSILVHLPLVHVVDNIELVLPRDIHCIEREHGTREPGKRDVEVDLPVQ
jgi:hypothetical protein